MMNLWCGFGKKDADSDDMPGLTYMNHAKKAQLVFFVPPQFRPLLANSISCDHISRSAQL